MFVSKDLPFLYFQHSSFIELLAQKWYLYYFFTSRLRSYLNVWCVPCWSECGLSHASVSLLDANGIERLALCCQRNHVGLSLFTHLAVHATLFKARGIFCSTARCYFTQFWIFPLCYAERDVFRIVPRHFRQSFSLQNDVMFGSRSSLLLTNTRFVVNQFSRSVRCRFVQSTALQASFGGTYFLSLSENGSRGFLCPQGLWRCWVVSKCQNQTFLVSWREMSFPCNFCCQLCISDWVAWLTCAKISLLASTFTFTMHNIKDALQF